MKRKIAEVLGRDNERPEEELSMADSTLDPSERLKEKLPSQRYKPEKTVSKI